MYFMSINQFSSSYLSLLILTGKHANNLFTDCNICGDFVCVQTSQLTVNTEISLTILFPFLNELWSV